MDKPIALTGQFLIAMPGMGDPNFARGVTLVCQHTAEGAIGLTLNRPSVFMLGDLLKQMEIHCELKAINALPVLRGGPVQNERGFVLHDGDHPWEASFRINDELVVTTSRDILTATAAGEGPGHIAVALGYAGWGAGQLDTELRENAWLTVASDNHIVFDTPLDERWSAAAGLVGVDLAQLAGYAGHT